MGKTIKEIADEIGVSKQAVYKRLTGKLKNVCAPYTYTEYNYLCLTEEGERIIKEDFIKNPCATPLREYGAVRSNPVSNTDNIRSETAPNTEYANTPYGASSVGAYTDGIQNTPTFVTNTAPEYVSHTEQIQPVPETSTEQSVKFTEHSVSDTEQSASSTPVSDTEQLHSSYGVHTEQSDTDTDELLEKLHQMEIELVKANAEIEKRDEKITHLQQRIEDKDQIISEQKESIVRIDSERKVLTASLFKNNAFIEDLLHLPLAKRIFGWNNVQKRLRDTQSDTQADITDEPSVIISVDGSQNTEND